MERACLRGVAWRRLARGFRLALLLGAWPLAAAADLDPADEKSWALPLADLYDVAAHGERVWAVGSWGTVLRSADGGGTWTRSPTPTADILFAVSFADSQSGWAVGAHGVILRSTDGGATWEQQVASVADEISGARPFDGPLFGVAAVSADEAWAVGDLGTVLHTTDGRQWQQVVLDPSVYADEDIPERILNGVAFTDPQHGWIAGEFGTLLRTSDGGRTWVAKRELVGVIPDIYLFDIAADHDGTAVTAGVGGVLVGTRDFGATWSALETRTTVGLFGTAWHQGRGIAVGDRGVIVMSQDGGRTWAKPQHPYLFNWLRGVTLSNGRAYAVGERGLVLRSRDGGTSWEVAAGEEPRPSTGVAVPEPGSSELPGRVNDAEVEDAETAPRPH